MRPIDYFVKTFVFAFCFTITYKLVFQLLQGFSTITLEFLLKTLLIALVTAFILGIINYFVKFDFGKKKQ